MRYVVCPLMVAFFVAIGSCGRSNLGKCPGSSPLVKCTELTADEKIRQALDQQDLATAQTLLAAAIADEPDNYERYPLLAAVYAGLSGFDLLAIASASSSPGAGGSIMDTMDAFLPSPEGLTQEEFRAKIDLMGQAITIIEALPAAFRATSGTDKFAASAVQQLGIYQTAQASMYMKLFTTDFNTGLPDLTQAANLTAEDAAAIMGLLANAAAGGGAFADIATSTLASINSLGGTDRDNLANFLGS